MRYNPIAPTAPVPTMFQGCAIAAPPSTPPVAVAAPIGLDLSGFKKKKEAGKATSEYPLFPDENGKAAETAAAIRSMQEEFESLEERR